MLNFVVDSNFFDVEEKLILNRVALDFTQKEFLNHCAFSMSVSEDDDCVALLEGLVSKIQKLSDEEWENLKSLLPFHVPLTDMDLTSGEVDVE